MKTNRQTWILFAGLSTLSFILWLWLSYPQLEFVNLSVGRAKAAGIAREYLRARQEDPARFRMAVVFSSDEEADRYLQHSVGFAELIQFVQKYDFDLFFWVVRFYRENEKEAYKAFVSSATGGIIGFQHTIDDSAAREPLEREEARRKAVEFLRKRFQFNPELYTVKGDLETVHDNRSDFSFSWQRKDVHIPWSREEPSGGTGKLLIGAKVSGQETLTFYKNTFSIPDQFNRYLARVQDTGKILSQAVYVLGLALFTSAVFFMIVRRNHLATHTTKRFYIGLMAFSFVLSLLAVLNQWQSVLFDYDTTGDFRVYIGQLTMQTLITALFVSAAVIMPGLAGEALHYQAFKEKPEGSFLYYLHSTFLSREVAKAIFLGYGVWIVMLGIQSVVIALGQRYAGVWVEHTWMNSLSTAYWPFFVAFTLGFKASITEELMFRMFAISFGKKILGNTMAAVILASLLWGFSHSNYPVFPMWFRGVEVTCLGLFLSWAYLRFGIIPVIVGHYLFDVFWNCAEYIFGVTNPFYFASSLLILLLPCLWAVVVFILNKKVELRPMRWRMTKHQFYNLEVLKTFFRQHPEETCGKPPQQIVDEISGHGWDPAVVEAALEDAGIRAPKT
ncbi:MAG: CPBP family intramembrane metalloprotease [Candidatus Omnitrophica bacterium]|nr:CPBP family intramembrane metalloprotease [Candidatus Omnitrophota bacterium]